jgi:hypothetical protein
MKLIKSILCALSLMTISANAVVTISANNFSSLSTGIPVLDSSGNAITAGNRSWSVGYFSNTFNFSTATAAQIIADFQIFGTTSTTFSLNGLFNGNRTATLIAGDTTYTGKTIYTVVGNNTTFAASTAFAIFASGAVFPEVDAGGNGSATSSTTTAGTVVYGLLRTINTQPSGSSTFAQGVQLLSAPIPETSTSLLGAIGALALLRRRRNA